MRALTHAARGFIHSQRERLGRLGELFQRERLDRVRGVADHP
jgi:hypothetical protein